MMSRRHMSIQENKQLSLWSVSRYAFINIEVAQLLQPETETTDPRILRSRRMLMEALARLLIRKEFEDVSVQEIADEATLNRATFYLHYADKNALLQAMTEARFRDLIQRRAITFTDCNGALRAIALGVCDYLAESTGCPTQLSRMALEGSIIPIVEDMFKEGLAHHGMAPGADASRGGIRRRQNAPSPHPDTKTLNRPLRGRFRPPRGPASLQICLVCDSLT